MNWFKRAIRRYDNWCKEMGLTPEQKRGCVPYRQDPTHQNEKVIATTKFTDDHRKSHDEAL